MWAFGNDNLFFSGKETGACYFSFYCVGGDNPLPELAHVVIGLESVSSLHEDYVTATVLSFLMGGGSSFSAGKSRSNIRVCC